MASDARRSSSLPDVCILSCTLAAAVLCLCETPVCMHVAMGCGWRGEGAKIVGHVLGVRCAAPHGGGGRERGRHPARALRRQLRRRARHLLKGAQPPAFVLHDQAACGGTLTHLPVAGCRGRHCRGGTGMSPTCTAGVDAPRWLLAAGMLRHLDAC